MDPQSEVCLTEKGELSGLSEVCIGSVSGRIEAFKALAEGNNSSGKLQSKCRQSGDLPTSELVEKVNGIQKTPSELVEKVWRYIEKVWVSVLKRRAENYPQLLSSSTKAAHNIVSRFKQQSVDWVNDIMEMEKLTDYTCNPDYVSEWSKLMVHERTFMNAVNDTSLPSKVPIPAFGKICVEHLRGGKDKETLVKEAFDLKMRITAYWNIVLRRLVDSMALHLTCNIQKLVNKEVEMEVIKELMGLKGDGMKRMLDESPAVAKKRKRLMNSLKLLKESKDVVDNIMDKIATDLD